MRQHRLVYALAADAVVTGCDVRWLWLQVATRTRRHYLDCYNHPLRLVALVQQIIFVAAVLVISTSSFTYELESRSEGPISCTSLRRRNDTGISRNVPRRRRC
ncbi:hypothetical protein BDN67DRAFT_273343 [Paxillus ammoniavirescens]|nr:hypothetical protein BDN67DRAFT_273343 [Paxillus ammoniavirescens]